MERFFPTHASEVDQIVLDKQNQIVKEFLLKNPNERHHVKRASYAYHDGATLPKMHRFLNSTREAPCHKCGRSREEVRWDDLPPECAGAELRSISNIIKEEELRFEKVINRTKNFIQGSLNGDSLCHIHNTFGITKEMINDALSYEGRQPLSAAVLKDYETCYEEHKNTGLKGLKKEVVKAKTLDDVTTIPD